MVSFAREESETSTRYGLESYERSYVGADQKIPLVRFTRRTKQVKKHQAFQYMEP